MNRLRLALVCLVAACAASCVFAVGSASALSLAEWQIEGETLKELSLTEETATSTSTGLFELNSKILGSPFKLKCEQIGTGGKLLQEAKGEVKLEWNKCAVIEPATCKVSEKMSQTLASQMIETGEILYEKIAPASGETLMEVTLSGTTCPLAGISVPFKGTALCEESEEAEEELVEQPFYYSEAISKAAGCGTYKLGKEAATISGEVVQKVKLAGPRAGKRFRPGRRVICKTVPQANKTCKAGEGYEGEVTATLAAGEKVEIANGAVTITCNESSFKGNYRPNGPGTVTSITYKEAGTVGGKCKTNRIGEPEVLLTFLELPTLTSKFQYKPTNEKIEHVGLLWWVKQPAEIPLKISWAAEVCIYEAAESFGLVVNGAGANPSKVYVSLLWEPVEAEKGNLALCPAKLNEKAAYFNLARGAGGNIYVTKP